jgi:hypothetical protein
LERVRVAILYVTPLFGQGLATLLREAGGIDVVATAPVSELPPAAAFPDVEAIIVEEEAAVDAAAAFRLPHTRSSARLIRVNLETAALHLEGRSSPTSGIERLLAALRRQAGMPVAGGL